jgi:hypothetical protein
VGLKLLDVGLHRREEGGMSDALWGLDEFGNITLKGHRVAGLIYADKKTEVFMGKAEAMKLGAKIIEVLNFHSGKVKNEVSGRSNNPGVEISE